MSLRYAALSCAAALAVAAACATPALAGSGAAPAQSATADARICAALTVDGVALLRRQPAVAHVLTLTPSLDATPKQIEATRARLGCGPAPADPAAVRLAVCAALDVSLIRRTVADASLTVAERAVVTALDGALPTIVGNVRTDLRCDGADSTTTPTATATPTRTAAPPETSSPGSGSGDGTDSGVTSSEPTVIPDGAPETGV